MRVALKDVVEQLPLRGHDLHLPTTSRRGVYTNAAAPEPYIWPDVDAPTSTLSTSEVLLVEAPGAMGKSSAARQIAQSIGAVFVDLAELRVGSGSLTGELAKALEFDAMALFVKELKAGNVAVVLDGTDEAQLGGGRDNYVEFLRDIQWLLGGALPAHQVILLGRPDATDTTLLALLELGFNPDTVRIAPLSHDQANSLIDETLDRRENDGGIFRVHRQHPTPFANLREAVFRGVASALTGEEAGDTYWDNVSDFLGYPPVVLALSERLAVDNPAGEVASEIPSGQKLRRGQLLRSILEKILEREQRKVATRVGDSLGLSRHSQERVVLYGPDEQIARILAATGTVSVALDAPAFLPDADRAAYEESVSPFVSDHPFLRKGKFANAVFRDYARSWAVSSPITGAFSKRRSDFLSTLPEVGPFFAHFVHALATSSASEANLPEDLVQDAVSSYALGPNKSFAIYLAREEGAILILHGLLESEEPALNFIVTELSGALTLSSPLTRITVITNYGVLIKGGVSGEISLGPGVSILADEIQFEGKTLTTYGAAASDSESFNMLAARAVEHDADLKVSALPPKSLLVNWPDAWNQWRQWVFDFGSISVPMPSAVVAQVLLGLKRILTAFRSSMRDDPSVSAEKVDQLLVANNPVLRAVLDVLLDLQIVHREGTLYRLDLGELSAFGVSYVALRGDDPTSSLKVLSSKVVEHELLVKFRKP